MISEILNPEKHSLYMYYKVNTNYSKYTEDSRVHSFIIHLFICSFVHSFRKKRQSNSYIPHSKTFVGYKKYQGNIYLVLSSMTPVQQQ